MQEPHQVNNDSARLPQHEVAVRMIDYGWNAPVGIILGELRCLVLSFGDVEVDGVVCETELLQDVGDFPAVRTLRVA